MPSRTPTWWTDLQRLKVPPTDRNCMTRCRDLIDERWDMLSHHVASTQHLFASWWERFGDRDASPMENEIKFDIFRRKYAKKLANAFQCGMIQSSPRRNLHEILTVPHFRITRKRIERAERLIEENPPESE